MSSVYHPGELAAQRKAGLRGDAERVAGIIGTEVPRAAAEFLLTRPMLVLAGTDADGLVWSSLLTGAPGFLRAGVVGGVDVLDIAARPLDSDPLAAVVCHGGPLGSIAVDPATRRRMRVNGTGEPTPEGLRIRIEQVYSNCPKYIQRRDLVSSDAESTAPDVTVAGSLSAADRAMIERADTFFVATKSATGDTDASHRGGNPGFVRVADDGSVSWPDYRGNAMMMTLGNLEQEPAAGLLFIDWAGGTTLQLSGTAVVEWGDEERRVRFTPIRVRRTERASGLHWSEPEYSRFNPLVA
ncbi:pyridoxamine 5'-phosphate oxidase family protein [Pseudonocardia spinosispora]|uniref:pyridoxamine 5'-phosphate oxidase family protein n=1 Tax=Pseudonocardia spinosispora TaxID=103441 RepID=UPI00041E829A|nr:pyridoxamine 5'-phosphate oxidase family protein [Pseudonocardia spinosispora]